MLGRRLISAAIIISVMLILIWFDYQLGKPDWLGLPGLVLGTLAIVVSGLAAKELVDLLQEPGRSLPAWIPVTGTMMMVTVDCGWMVFHDDSALIPLGTLGWSTAGIALAIAFTLIVEMMRFGPEPRGQVLNRICRYVFLYGYLQMLFAFLLGHRLLDQDNAFGLFTLILLMLTVKFSDAMAYFVGKAIGSTPIAPQLSPKKTLQGLLGGFAGGTLGAAFMVYLIAPQVFQLTVDRSFLWVGAYGILVTAAGVAGDLAESMIKREANCKDSSGWLPGLGGVLDIADSLVFAAPVSFLLLM